MRASNLHAVVPVHNGAKYLDALVRSLAAQTQPPDHIHLVDNGSTEPPWSIPGELQECVSIHQTKQSLGFGAACNLGISVALGQGAEYILVLNQDLVLEESACENVTKALRDNDSAGLVGLLQLTYDGTSVDQPFRNIMPHSLIDDLLLREVQDVYECDFVPAAAILIPATALRHIGGFDPLYFMYQEDKDFCQRVRNAGLRVLICTTARVRHDCGQFRAVRDHQWHENWFYSRAISHLKSSQRPLWMSYLTSFKYMIPRWNTREAWWWFKGVVKSLSHYKELRRRREDSDGLALTNLSAHNSSSNAKKHVTVGKHHGVPS